MTSSDRRIYSYRHDLIVQTRNVNELDAVFESSF